MPIVIQDRPKIATGMRLDEFELPRLLPEDSQWLAEGRQFEFITDKAGQSFVYDINTNTNYNSDAEGRANLFAMDKLAEHLIAQLDQHLSSAA